MPTLGFGQACLARSPKAGSKPATPTLLRHIIAKHVMDRMLLQHEGDYGLGMDAMVTVCSWNTKEIMVWAWM